MRLRDVAKVNSGKTPSTKNKEYWKNGTINWYTGKDITKKSLFSERKITKIASNKMKTTTKNSILMAIVGSANFFIPLKNSTFNQQIVAIEPNEKLILKKYLFYFLEARKKEFEISSTSSIFFLMPKTYVEKIKIEVPILKYQRQIIDIIEPLENLFTTSLILKPYFSKFISKIIESKNKEKDAKQIIDIIEPLEKLHDNYSYLKKEFINLGMFLEKKNRLKIKKNMNYFSNIFSGGTPPTKIKKYWTNEEWIWIDSGALTNNPIITKNSSFKSKMISHSAILDKKTKLLSGTNILLSDISPSKNKISITKEEIAISNHVVVVQIEKDNHFVYFSLLNNISKLKQKSKGSVITQVSINDIKNTKINEIKNKLELKNIFEFLYALEEKSSILTKQIDFLIKKYVN